MGIHRFEIGEKFVACSVSVNRSYYNLDQFNEHFILMRSGSEVYARGNFGDFKSLGPQKLVAVIFNMGIAYKRG